MTSFVSSEENEDMMIISGHDSWSGELDSNNLHENSSSEIDDAKQEIEDLTHENGHLRWHLAKYREALDKAPNGLQLLIEVHNTVDLGKKEVGCTECIIETLRHIIADLRDKLSNATAANEGSISQEDDMVDVEN